MCSADAADYMALCIENLFPNNNRYLINISGVLYHKRARFTNYWIYLLVEEHMARSTNLLIAVTKLLKLLQPR